MRVALDEPALGEGGDQPGGGRLVHAEPAAELGDAAVRPTRRSARGRATRGAPTGGSNPVGLAYRNTSDLSATRRRRIGTCRTRRSSTSVAWVDTLTSAPRPGPSVAQRAPLASPRGAPRPTLSRMTERYWRAAEPKSSYDVVIVGAGGHGLATAYYLAANHGITDVCVVEKGWLGGGNMARNTTIIRSNYLWDESAAIYEHSLKLWEGLEETLSLRHAVLPARRPEPGPRPGRHPHLQAPRLRQRASTGSTPSGSTPTRSRRSCPS